MIDVIQCIVVLNSAIAVSCEIVVFLCYLLMVLTTEPSVRAAKDLREPLVGLMVIPAWPVALGFALRDRIQQWNAYNRRDHGYDKG